jgi:hypothetical protein
MAEQEQYRDVIGLGMARGIKFSDRLVQMMEELTPLQQKAIPKIVLHLWEEDGALTHLLRTADNKGPHTICAYNTWYKSNGWANDETFQEALALAKKEYAEAMLGQAVPKTVEEIRKAGPRVGKQINAFLSRVDDADLFEVLVGLVERGEGEGRDQQARVVMGMLREWARLRDSVLDRLDVETGVKETGGEAQRLEAYLEALREAEEQAEDGEQG